MNCKGFNNSLKENAIITDVGSVKGSVVQTARKFLGSEHLGNFVPAHPVAGTEKSGVEASFAELSFSMSGILAPAVVGLPSCEPRMLSVTLAARVLALPGISCRTSSIMPGLPQA